MNVEAIELVLLAGMKRGGFDDLEIEPCNLVDLEELRNALPSHEIPKFYENFLLCCGRRMSYFQPVLTFFFSGILRKNISFFSEESIKNGLFKRLVSSGADKDKILAGIVVATHLDDTIYLLLPDHNGHNLFFASQRNQFLLQKSKFDFRSQVLHWFKIFINNHAELIQSHPDFFNLIKDFRTQFLGFYFQNLRPYATRYEGRAISVMNSYDRVLTKLYRAIEDPSRQLPSILFDLGTIDLIGLDNQIDSGAIIEEGHQLSSLFLNGVNSYWERNRAEWVGN